MVPENINDSCSRSSDIDENSRENIGIDQVVTDLAILEQQLINSMAERKDPLIVQPDLEDTIISGIENYFAEKSSATSKEDPVDPLTQPDTPIVHQPYINTFNQSTANTRILIQGLEHAHMYMFQVFACHDLRLQSPTKACSANGIIITVRTKPGNGQWLVGYRSFLTPRF